MGLSNYAAPVSRWFKQYRGLAMGIAFAGTGAGAFVIVPLTERWISAWGWQNALIGQATLLVAIVLPISLFLLRARPADMGLQPDGEAMAEAFISPPVASIHSVAIHHATQLSLTKRVAAIQLVNYAPSEPSRTRCKAALLLPVQTALFYICPCNWAGTSGALAHSTHYASVDTQYSDHRRARQGEAKTPVVVPVVRVVPVAGGDAKVVCIVVVPRTTPQHAPGAPT